MKYKVGDRVEAIGFIYGSIPMGSRGTVCEVGPLDLGIRWDEHMGVCHSCNGACDYGHGFYVLRRDVRKIEDFEDVAFSFDETRFMKMMGYR